VSTDLPTEADFVPCTTKAGAKRHYALKSFLRLTLCGNLADNIFMWPDSLPPCKQCEKSRSRQIEGRPH